MKNIQRLASLTGYCSVSNYLNLVSLAIFSRRASLRFFLFNTSFGDWEASVSKHRVIGDTIVKAESSLVPSIAVYCYALVRAFGKLIV